MKHLALFILLSLAFWNCSDNNSDPKPDPIKSPDIDITDIDNVEDAFLDANSSWEKKDGALPASVGNIYVSVALYDTLDCFNGRETSIGFNNYNNNQPEGFYVRIVGSNSYYVVPVNENLRIGINSENAQRLIEGNPMVIEPRGTNSALRHGYDEMYFMKAIIPSSIKPGTMELEFKAFFSNGDVSELSIGQMKIHQLGGVNKPNSSLLTRSWKIEKMNFNDPWIGIQEIIFGTEQTQLFSFSAYCLDGTTEVVTFEISYIYNGGISISRLGTYNSVLDLKGKTANFGDPNWDCGDPIIYTDVEDRQDNKGGWGLSDDGKYFIAILDPYFDDDGYYYPQSISHSEILEVGLNKLILREYDRYDPSIYTDISLIP